MDVDRFLAANSPAWARLGELTRRAGRGVGRLSASEIDELVVLYQRVSSHLSYARTYYRDPALNARLTGLVAAAGAVVYGTRPKSLRAFGRFFTTTFPAAVWHARRFVVVSAVLTFVPAAVLGVWLARDPQALEAVATPEERRQYVEEDFEDYYSEQPSAQFASQVFTNNVRVAILAFAAGVVVCVVTAYVLVTNGAALGAAAGLFAAAGRTPKFWGAILPHGLLELSAVVVAGAAGLALGWAVVDPGDRTRAEALTEEGRRSVVVVLGLILAFAVAGLIEGFVTGSALPPAAKVAVGVLAEAAFVGWVVVQGRAAAARGLTGALGEEAAAGWATPRAAPA